MNAMHWQLHPGTRADLAPLHALANIPQVYRFLADDIPPSRDLIKAWIEVGVSDAAGGALGLWLLRQDTRDIGGCVRLTTFTDEPRAAELTYLLHPRCWGQGLATRMSWTVVQRALATGQIDAVVAGADVPNVASRAVMTRLGMTFRRDVVYAAWPGVESVFRRGDALPAPVPELLPIAP